VWYIKTEMAEEKKGIPVALLIGAAVALVLGGGVFALARFAGGPKGIVELTPEAKAYTKNLKLAGVEMKATEAYLGNAVVEITGKITNAGNRPVQQVDLMCVFYDVSGQLLTRERVPLVRARNGGLPAGATKEFRMPFDNLTGKWNQRMPQMVIAGIVF
jgi:hypothetical protein